MTAVLEVQGLVVPFGAGPGLTGVDFSVAPGETLGLVGPSGVGKTTLLRALAGLAPRSAGTIRVLGRDVTGLPPERRGLVYLHQSPVLFPHMSVAQNIAFALRLRRAPAAAQRERVRELLAAIDMVDYGERPPASLSGGQQQRVALARAIAANPAALLLDEPYTGLDPGLRGEVRDAVVALQAIYDIAVVLVTHDLDEAGIAGNRVGILLSGALRQTGTMRDLVGRPASREVAKFVGMRNEVSGVLRTDGVFESILGEMRIASAGISSGPAAAMFTAAAVEVREDPRGCGRIVSHRHYRDGVTALVDLGPSTRIEAALPERILPEGACVRIRVRADQVVLFRVLPESV